MKQLSTVPILRAQASQPNGDTNLVAMINIVFLLLIFFLISGSIRTPDPVQLQLPSSDANKQAGQNEAQILIGPQGGIWLNAAPVQLDMLAPALIQNKSGLPYRVQVRADKQSSVALLTRVLSAAQAAGATNVSVLARNRN